jgi:transposase
VARHRPPGLDLKKKTLSASEQDPARRASWWDELATYDPADFVFLDETSISIALTRRYARAPRGQRAPGQVPRNHGTPTTLLAALSPAGLGAAMTLEGAANTAAFTAYVREVLCPTLHSGQLVLVDNVSFHRAEAIRELIEAAECVLVFLPPYSPDFNPIEHAFSKLKTQLRATAARTQAALETAIADALDQITAADARGWFRHCGYELLDPPA